VVFSSATYGDENIALCGHEEHDSLALRAQASTLQYWRNETASNSESWVRFKILGFNDFHGALEQRTLFGRPVAGAAVLSSYFNFEIEESENGAIIVHAGDFVGASPPISALLQDEPSISFMNMVANEHCEKPEYKADEELEFNPKCNVVSTLGNHEFDEGVTEMQRLISGGTHKNGPFLDANYNGANFPYISANVVDIITGKPILPPYVIKKVKGQRIAFIGAVLKETPTIVTPSGVAGIEFLDEATAINSYIPELKKKNIHSIVVIIHQGTRQSFYGGPTTAGPLDLGSSIGTIVKNLDDEIDIVISGHAHGFTNQLVENNNGKQILVTQAFSSGTAYADIDIAIDPATHDIVEKSAAIITTFADIGAGLTPDDDVTELVQSAAATVAPIVNRVIGTAVKDIVRQTSPAGESALGNLIADAQRAAMNTDVAFMNPGGIRAEVYAGEVTWGELFTVQPFNNDLIKMNLTGEQIVRLLNQQWFGQSRPRILKTSGIIYNWDATRIESDRVIVSSIQIGNQLIDLAAVYSVTVNSFIASGGDNFSVLTEGTNKVVGAVDIDALVNYIGSLIQPFSASIEGRILKIN